MTTANATNDKWNDSLWQVQQSLNKAVSTALDMSLEMIMFEYELPLRANQLILLDCPQQEEQEGGLPRLPMRIRHNQLKDMQDKHKTNPEQRNEKLRNNSYKVGDLVLKQTCNHLCLALYMPWIADTQNRMRSLQWTTNR